MSSVYGILPASELDARLARLRELATAIDEYVADRPELVTSQFGFAVGLIVGAIRSNPAGALDQLSAVSALLDEAMAYVDRGERPSRSELLSGLR